MDIFTSTLNFTCKAARVIRFVFIALFLFGVWSSLNAAPLTIDVSKSKIKTIPIAFTNFNGALGNQIADIIAADLENSGQFNQIKDNLIYNATFAKHAGADYLVHADVVDRPFSFDLNVQLQELDGDNKIIFNDSFMQISKKKSAM